MSKHDDIIKYISALEVGSKISVRSIATGLSVSDGTAYRAIKDSEALGIVTTIPRVGTVRIEKIEKKSIETLTYGEIVNIIDGSLLGGKDGIHKTLSKFVIGAMTIDAMERYISPGCLLIVGNRIEAQRLALENESAVLITGGFSCSDEIKRIANEKCLPIISSEYDTFTIASMINKAISQSLIKKDIIYAEDIMIQRHVTLNINDNVAAWKKLIKETKLLMYPVVDNDMRVLGIVTIRDFTSELNDRDLISKVMIKDFISVTPKTTVAFVAHIMNSAGIDQCPVVQGRKLAGILRRQDVMKTLQYISRQPQSGENLDELILNNFRIIQRDNRTMYSGNIIPEMLDPIGTASWSSLNMLLTTIGIMTLKQQNDIDLFVDSVSTCFIKPVQIDSVVSLSAEIMDMGKNYGKVEVNMHDNKSELIAKALMSVKFLRKDKMFRRNNYKK